MASFTRQILGSWILTLPVNSRLSIYIVFNESYLWPWRQVKPHHQSTDQGKHDRNLEVWILKSASGTLEVPG